MSKGGGSKFQRKKEYFSRLTSYLTDYSKILVVVANNVGSKQLQQVRSELRGKGVLLMGKNTMVRKCMRQSIAKLPALEQLLPHIKGNVGFVFTNEDLATVRDRLTSVKVKAAAKSGAVAPCDVIVPAGSTGQEPSKTSFFQALSIPTRINKGSIEIINDVHLIKTGAKVSASQAALLQMLAIQPFEYALVVKTVYDEGSIYPASLLDISDQDILSRFSKGVANVAALSLKIGYPTVASVPYAMINSFRDLVSVALVTNYTFKQADAIKDMIANPDKYAGAAPAAGSTSTAAAPAAAAAAAAPAAEEEKEEEEEMGAGGLFGEEEDY